jgi:hypothetical protein
LLLLASHVPQFCVSPQPMATSPQFLPSAVQLEGAQQLPWKH